MRRHPYRDFLHKVAKPARYLGGEYLARPKPPGSVEVSLCLAFPDLYDIGMSHQGTKVLYGLLNDQPDIACERAFAPWPDMEAELRRRGLPVLSLESARPLRDFDAVGFSLQYELTYTNVLNLLDLSGIPLRAAERGDGWPLILAGGPVVTHAEPLAPFLDALLVGEAEELLPRSLRLLARWRDEGRSKQQVLQGLAELGGWYCPELYALEDDPRSGLLVVDAERSEGPLPVVRARVDDLDRYPFPCASPVAAAEAVFDRMGVEIARGCTEGCRFCQAGIIYRPARERSPRSVIDTIAGALDRGGYSRVSLSSLSTADYSAVDPLVRAVMEQLRPEHVSLSVSSLRAYGLSEALLDEIASVKTTGLTLAPEAGTQRLRDVINKNVAEADLLETVERAFARGWSRVKLYFMIGLPSETDEDVAGIIETAARVRAVGKRLKVRRLEVTTSVSSFVPKPHTPFQWAAMDSREELQRKQALLRSLGRERRLTVRHHDTRVSFLEALAGRGDRRVADLIEEAWRRGCRFDGWDERLDWQAWQDAIAATDIDPTRYLGALPEDARLPWSHIDVGVTPEFLAREWRRARAGRTSPPCGKPAGCRQHPTNLVDAQARTDELVCYHCGLDCDLAGMRERRQQALRSLDAIEPPSEAPADLPQVRRNRHGARLPPLRPEQGEGFRYRVIYTKLGAAAYIGQLDLTRQLPRVLRRAGLRVKFTAGFSPRPVLSYSPALPVGVSSLAEVLDLTLLEEPEPADLVARLAAVADPGLHVLDAARLPGDTANCARAAKLAEYLVAAPDAWSTDALQAGAERARGDEPVRVTVVRKDSEREVDVRSGLVTIAPSEVSASEALALELDEGTPVLRWRVDLDAGASVRPDDLARGVLGCDERPPGYLGARVGLWGLRKGRVYGLLTPADRFSLEEHERLPTFRGLPQPAT